MFSNLTKLPVDFVGAQILQYLPLVDLVNFDSAILEKRHRPLFESVISSAVVTIPESFTTRKRQGCWDWCIRRGITLESLILEADSLEGRDADLLPKILCRIRSGGVVTVKKVWKSTLGTEAMGIFNRPEVLDKVSCLELVSVPGAGPFLDVCAGLKRLNKISIVGSQVAEGWIAGCIASNKNLRVLELKKLSTLGAETASALRAVGPSIQELSLEDTILSPDIFDAIQSDCCNLTELTLEGRIAPKTSFGAQAPAVHPETEPFGASVARAVQGCPELRTLTLKSVQPVLNDAVLSIAKHCAQLQRLCFTNRHGELTDAALLAFTANCHDLHHLDGLTWSVGSLENVEAAKALLQRLKFLHISAGAAEHSTTLCHALGCLDTVSVLHLDGVTPAHAPALTTVKAPRLRELTIHCDTSVELRLDNLFLALAGTCSNVTRLEFKGPIQVEEASAFALVGGCPALEGMLLDGVHCAGSLVSAVVKHCPHITAVFLSDATSIHEDPLLELASAVTKCPDLHLLRPPSRLPWPSLQKLTSTAKLARGKDWALGRWNS